MMILSWKVYLLPGILLLLSERATADGCGFCQGGNLSNPEGRVALSAPEETHSCLDWQRSASLTENFGDEACRFVAPFFDAICGCSNGSRVHDQCHLCGNPTMVFGEPNKGLVIPNSNNQKILCRTIYSGVQMGAVPASDCQVLGGITDYCGGCVANEAAEAAAASAFFGISTPAKPSATAGPTAQPSMAEFAAVANFPEMETGQPSAGPSSGPTSAPTVKPSQNPTSSPTLTPTMKPSEYPTATHSSAPSSSPTMKPSPEPTAAHSSAPTIAQFAAALTATPTMKPSPYPTSAPSLTPTKQPSKNPTVAPTGKPSSKTCDLCPLGTLERPEALISLVSMADQTVTKSCGSLLWNTRNGQNDFNESSCTFLRPFYGAICGCSTFIPLWDDSDVYIGRDGSVGTKQCNLCKNPTHVFQNPDASLPIPGSDTTEITCGGLFSGALNGALTAGECEMLSAISASCGGCGSQSSIVNVQPAKPEQEPVQEVELEEESGEEPEQKPEQESEYELGEELEEEPELVSTPTSTKCVDCLDERESSIYVYKDFGTSGTTFQRAFSAPLHCDDRTRNPDQRKTSTQNDCHRLSHPELEGCVLTPITSFDELVRVQSVIPPGKAAYTAVHKDRLAFKSEADECYNNDSHFTEGVDIEVSGNGKSGPVAKCSVENWMEGLDYGFHENETKGTARLSKSDNNSSDVPCESLKSGWTNYMTGISVPSSLWKNGQPSYCSLGPTQEVGAVWAVEEDGQNYGDLRDVSTNWPLPGAVYKCCKTIYSCFA